MSDELLDELTLEAGDPDTDPDLLAALEKHPNARVRAELARNISTPFSSLILFETDNHPLVRSAMAANQQYHFSVRETKNQNRDTQRVIARMPHTPADTLDALADDPELRMLVALNPSAHHNTLDRLANLDPDSEADLDIVKLHVRLIQNPSTPTTGLRTIMHRYEKEDGTGYPQAFLPTFFKHLGVDGHTFRRYGSKDPKVDIDAGTMHEIRRSIYANPACPVDMLIIAALDPWSMVAMGEAAENSSLPDTTRQRIS